MKQVSLRPVKKKDWDFILSLRNDDKTRDNFYTKNKIKKKDHYKYLQEQAKNPNFFHWIISYGNSNAGYVRILENDISIMLNNKFQNKGIGTSALKLIEKEAKLLGIKKLVGRVMVHNVQSKKIFEKNNYTLLMYWLEKYIS